MAARESTSAPFHPDAWMTQDGPMVGGESRQGRSHAGQQWDARCPDGWDGFNVRSAWQTGEPVKRPTGDGTTARLHRPSEMLLIAEFGFIVTAIPARWELTDDQIAGDGDPHRDIRFIEATDE